MGVNVRRRVLITGAFLLLVTRGYALEIGSYHSLRQSGVQSDSDSLDLWIDGMIDGVKATNMVLEMKGRQKLFCKPVLTRELAYMLIDSRLKKKKYKSGTPVDIVFVFGLTNTFPCGDP